MKRYREQFGDGMSLKVSKRDREVTYRPASPSLLDLTRVSDAIKPVRIPHVMGIQSQFKPLIDVWTSCIEDLKPLSRAMARGAEVLTREAYDALPDDLKPGVEHPDKSDWDRIVAENAREEGAVLVTVGHLATIHGIAQREAHGQAERVDRADGTQCRPRDRARRARHEPPLRLG